MLCLVVVAVAASFGDKEGYTQSLPNDVMWPKHIYMTDKDLGRVPSYVHDALRRYAPGYRVSWFDDSNCLAYMTKHSTARVLAAYQSIPNGAHRADMWRYQILRTHGGVYLDADLILKRPLDEVFRDRRLAYTAIDTKSRGIFQAVLVSPPHNPVFAKLIDLMVETVTRDYDYDVFTRQFYTQFTNVVGPGQYSAFNTNWELFQERCGSAAQCGDRKDKYGFCCNVYNARGDLLMGSRYPDFPF
jgi:hypothetical protein